MDIVLRNVASSPATEIILPVDEDDEGPRYSEGRAQLIPELRSEGPLSWKSLDPVKDLQWTQDDWSDGALQPYYRPDDPHRYAKSDNVDLRWEGVAALGMVRTNTRADFIIRNPDAERNATTGWSVGTGVTFTTQTGAANTGTYGFRAITDGSRTSGDNLFTQALANPTVYQSARIKVGVRLRRTSGSESGVRLSIVDSVGATNSSSVTSGTYTFVSAIHLVNGGATSLTIVVETDTNETGAHTYEVDDFVIQVGVASEGATTDGEPICRGVAEHNGLLYAGCGRMVLQWNETDDVWELVLSVGGVASGSFVSDLIHYGNNILVANGTGRDYTYGSGTTWTDSNRTAPDDKAVFWAVARDGSGSDAIWKSEATDSVANTTDPINGAAAWSTPIVVGSSDREITGLFGAFDSLQVGKEDGLWDYQRFFPGTNSADGKFRNIAPDFDVDVDTENFDKGLQWKGWLYLTTSRQGFIRWRPGQFDDISGFFVAPRLTDFGGRVRAMANSPKELFLMVDTPQTDTSSTKDTRLMSMQLGPEGLNKPHTLADVSVGIIHRMAVHKGFLYSFGVVRDDGFSEDVAAIYRWELPSKTVAPFADDTPAIELSGTFDTSIWHGDLPDTEKAFLAFTIWCAPLDAEHTVKVTYGLDGAAITTTTLGTFSGTGRIQTLYFTAVSNPETNAIGRMVQFQFTLTTDDTVSPEVYAFALHTTGWRLTPCWRRGTGTRTT